MHDEVTPPHTTVTFDYLHIQVVVGIPRQNTGLNQ